MGLGAVLIAPDGQRHTISVTGPEHGCNNEAELRAVMAALRYASGHGARSLRLHCDNSIVVSELAGRAARPMARLGGLFDEARGLVSSFADVALIWVPRHRNPEADALARAALGLAPKLVKTVKSNGSGKRLKRKR